MNVKKHPYYGNKVINKSVGLIDFKADADSRKVSFYAAAFGNKDSVGDILVKGCFAKSIQEHGPGSKSDQKIAYLYMHNMDKPIGRITSLIEDDKGLYVEAILDDIEKANDVLKQYQSGTLNQHSIGFRYMWDTVEYDEAQDAYIVKEVQLWEVSVVTLGANENTPFMGLKSEELQSEIEKLDRESEIILKSLDPVLSYRLRQLMTNYKSLAEAEPVKIIQKQEPTPPSFDWAKVGEELKKVNN